MTIKMIGMVGAQPNKQTSAAGIHPGVFREMIRDTEAVLGLTENTPSIDRATIKNLVKEEYVKIQKEMEAKAPKIAKKLEKLRKEYFETMFEKAPIGSIAGVGEKRIQLSAVSNLIDVPVNELVLYFLNNVKTVNERSAVEYRLGHVYFYPL